jgi:transposase
LRRGSFRIACGGRFQPLVPKKERRFRYPGRKRLDDRAALQGILFVLYTGIAWRHLPLELGFGSGSTCYGRLVEWQETKRQKGE